MWNPHLISKNVYFISAINICIPLNIKTYFVFIFTGKDDYRIKYEVLFKEHADLKNKVGFLI